MYIWTFSLTNDVDALTRAFFSFLLNLLVISYNFVASRLDSIARNKTEIVYITRTKLSELQAKTREVLEARHKRGPVERRNERQGRVYREGNNRRTRLLIIRPGFGGDDGSEERSGEAEEFDC